MSVIKLEVPADNALALSAAASFFMQLAGLKQTTVTQSVSHALDVSTSEGPAVQLQQLVRAATDTVTDDEQDNEQTDGPQSFVNGVEVDSEGLPWDKRIHSSARSKVKDGPWKKLRGVDSALVAQVEAELRQNMAPEIPAPAGKEPEVPVAAATPEAPTAGAPQLPVQPEAPVAAAPAVNAEAIGFPDLMKIYAPMRVKNPGIEEEAKAWCIAQGLTGLPGLAVNAELRPAFKAFLESKQ